MKNNIIYSNKELFTKKLDRIKKDWKNRLHILSDFDRTLTKCFINWKSRPSIISAMREWDYLWNIYPKKAHELFNHYNSIELDPNIEIKEKKEKMQEWWSRHLDLLVKSWLNKNNIIEVIESWMIELREWMNKFLKLINSNKVPLIIISANWLWWDFIKLYLEKKKILNNYIFIISNEFIWDENDFAKWYKSAIIHTFNKSETVLKDNKEIYKEIENKKNVILIWDSLWDPNMIDWFEYENLVKIGFLNHDEEKLLSKYKEVYDIIITWDWDFSIINEILESIK